MKDVLTIIAVMLACLWFVETHRRPAPPKPLEHFYNEPSLKDLAKGNPTWLDRPPL